jgi:hypothetical protein
LVAPLQESKNKQTQSLEFVKIKAVQLVAFCAHGTFRARKCALIYPI